MKLQICLPLAVVLVSSWSVSAYQNYTGTSLLRQDSFSLREDRPDGCPECPRCFDCHYEQFQCTQYANCSQYNGKCACPAGFGGDDCSEPVCSSLADGKNRSPRGANQKYCDCDEGWEGVNCNVCQTDQACNALMPTGEGGVCYQTGAVVHENYQMCNITNRKILDQLGDRKPQATFSCNANDATCNFQFWVDQVESFYCALDNCTSDAHTFADRNTTEYKCQNVKCKCIPDRMLCGEAGSVDIGEFLDESIRGPATFKSLKTHGGSSEDGSKFEEPAMNDLISSIFGDKSITLSCRFGECLYVSDVPGYTRPVKEINTPLIAGVIAGCTLFVVAAVVGIWLLQRRTHNQKYGAIYLEDSDDDSARLLADHKPVALQFDNISYSLNGKLILSGIQGIARPGQVMAIMGASGAGKSTFLDILARKHKRGTVEGDVHVNGEKVSDVEFRAVSGFVDQEDTMLPTLTVHETIMTSALLRLPRDMHRSTKEQQVYEVERQLGIYQIRNQLIGSEEGSGRGISGGEKRRVGIACELVTSPSILFLDEPTSGLDAFNAFNVVECLVTLARTYNRTVIFTIHQPRSNIAALFDQLILLAKGKTVYSGPFHACQSYFDHMGYMCPPGFNIADYLVDLTMHAGMARSPVSEEGPIDFGSGDGLRTGSSSMRAIKSIASASNISNNAETGSHSSPREGDTRPKGRRRVSIKQQQDRQLFKRQKNSDTEPPPTPRTDDEDHNLSNTEEGTQNWLKLQQQKGAAPPQILDDLDELPPPASDENTDLDVLVASYKSSDIAKSIQTEIGTAVQDATTSNGDNNGQPNGTSGLKKNYRTVSLPRQFLILSMRTWRNIYRNPMLMLTHYLIAMLLAVLCGYLFYGLSDDIAGFQDRLGLFFFILALFGFSTLTSLTVFSSERLLFVRERANGYYAPITYYAAKVIFDIVPLRLLPPIILGVIVYPMVGLDAAAGSFFKFLLILVLFNLASAAICLFIGIVFQDPGVANLIGSLTMLFSLLFAGLLLNANTIPKSAMWLQSVSVHPVVLDPNIG